MTKRIPIISFFSGGGFMDMGFINAGFDVVFANEFDKTFAKLHDEGISSWSKGKNRKPCLISSTNSLTELSPKIILKKAFPDGTPQLWGIIGGPPCQDFTMNGEGKGFQGQRGKMTHIFYNRIRKMKPAFFVMENVVGLLMRKETKQILDMLLFNNISNDYYIDRKTLNALEYGVPQYRQRVFIVGLRKDIFQLDNNKTSSIEDILSFSFPWPKPKYPNARFNYKWPVQNPFGYKNVIKPSDIPDELCVETCLHSAEDLPNGNEYFLLMKDVDLRKTINEGDTQRRSFKRLHRYRFSPTTCFGNNEVFLHPYKNRRLTVRESLRIQSVEDSYVWSEGLLSSKFKIISNGVPVKLAQAVAEELYKLLKCLEHNRFDG